jgi:hypothetical protein
MVDQSGRELAFRVAYSVRPDGIAQEGLHDAWLAGDVNCAAALADHETYLHPPGVPGRAEGHDTGASR